MINKRHFTVVNLLSYSLQRVLVGGTYGDTHREYLRVILTGILSGGYLRGIHYTHKRYFRGILAKEEEAQKHLSHIPYFTPGIRSRFPLSPVRAKKWTILASNFLVDMVKHYLSIIIDYLFEPEASV